MGQGTMQCDELFSYSLVQTRCDLHQFTQSSTQSLEQKHSADSALASSASHVARLPEVVTQAQTSGCKQPP